MSTEQSIDPQVIEQTKQQIRSLVNEIAQLSKSELTPEEYYGEFLTRVVTALAAVGGAVWTKDAQGRLALQFQQNLAETRLAEREEAQKKHTRLLYRTLQTGEGGLMLPNSGSGDDEEAGNPTDFLLVLGPLKTELETVGVVEIIQRPDTGLSTQRGYLRFVTQMCDLAGEFLKSHQLRRFSDRQVLWTQLEEFTHVIHGSLDPKVTAYTIANEARRLIDCDRVSIALRRGRRCTIEAVSGQDLFDKRSNAIRLLGKLASEVVAAGDPVWYSGDTRDFPPQIEEAVQEYVDEAHSKTVAILPLRRPLSEAEKENEERMKRKPEPPFGALIVEQIEDSRLPEALIQRVNVVCRHTSTALGNAVEYNTLFLMPLWRAIGKSRILFEARNLPKTISIGSAVLIALLALIFYPADFELQAKGSLEPIDRRDVFAQHDGVVDKLLVDHGSVVTDGQLLGMLRNNELDVQMTELAGQRATARTEMESIRRQLMEEKNRMTHEEQNRLSGKVLELKKQLESMDAKWAIYQKRKKDLEIVSPADGTVVTWDLQNRLIERPVMRGAMLMRVGNLKGDWQLELKMPEDRLGAVVQAQHELAEYDGKLPVTYILASEPAARHKGTIKKIHESAEVHGEEGSQVLIKVAINKADLPAGYRPGTQITAKVYCGRRSIGYVWFHDFLAFLQSKVFFKFF